MRCFSTEGERGSGAIATPFATMRPGGGGVAATGSGAGARRTFLPLLGARTVFGGAAAGFGADLAFLRERLDSLDCFGVRAAELFGFPAVGSSAFDECRFCGALALDLLLDRAAFLAFVGGAVEVAPFLDFAVGFSNLVFGPLTTDFLDLAVLAALRAVALADLDLVAFLAFGGLLSAFLAGLGAAECFVARSFDLPPFRAGLAAGWLADFFAAFVARAAIRLISAADGPLVS